MRIALLSLIMALSVTSSEAADIEGWIVVMDKSGQSPLKSHAHAIVYLEGFISEPDGVAVMDQQAKKFMPRLLPAIRGQTIRFENSDIYQHTVFSTHPTEPFSLPRYGQGESRNVVLHDIGPHPIFCDIHQSMVADVYVVPNRYFAVTDDKGFFRIADVPAGRHRLRAWHILGGNATLMVDIETENRSVSLELQSVKTAVETPASPRPSTGGNTVDFLKDGYD
jgi:plastocyanin